MPSGGRRQTQLLHGYFLSLGKDLHDGQGHAPRGTCAAAAHQLCEGELIVTKKKSTQAEGASAEADDGYLTVKQCGVTLRIPVGGKVPIKAIEAFHKGDNFGGTKALLGEEQWNALLAKNPTIDDFNAIGTQIDDMRKG